MHNDDEIQGYTLFIYFRDSQHALSAIFRSEIPKTKIQKRIVDALNNASQSNGSSFLSGEDILPGIDLVNTFVIDASNVSVIIVAEYDQPTKTDAEVLQA